MKVFSLQAPIYRGAWLSSRLTAQTSQLAAVRRDALERWRRARSRGLSAEEATALVVNGFVKDVLQQLPMEFAVEAQKLISVSLEGSVG